MSYQEKYLKYKTKYFNLKNKLEQSGGANNETDELLNMSRLSDTPKVESQHRFMDFDNELLTNVNNLKYLLNVQNGGDDYELSSITEFDLNVSDSAQSGGKIKNKKVKQHLFDDSDISSSSSDSENISSTDSLSSLDSSSA